MLALWTTVFTVTEQEYLMRQYMQHWYNLNYYPLTCDSMADNCPTCILLKAVLQSVGVSAPVAETVAYSPPVQQAEDRVVRKAKKKVSKYQREFGKQLKKLKKKHPKSKIGNLMKRAHRLTKKMLK